MKKTIGVLAHVDAGKTTFSEQVLYHTKSIKTRGRVDHKNSFLDSHDIEKKRGITVFSDQAVFDINDSTYYLIDTPGHIDFSCEMERAIRIMDYAIVIVSAVEGVQGHTETVWNLLRKYKVPTFFFINKLDRTGADLKRVLQEINNNLSKDVCFITDLEEMNEEVIEFIAEKDELLLEKYLNDEYCGFICTTSFYHDLIKGLFDIHKKENMESIPKELPIYIIAGDKDPVGRQGKGILDLYDRYKKLNIKDVNYKLYENGRHEILNEINKDEVIDDILIWMNGIL